MLQQRAPMIAAGQIYLNAALNEYMIVTKNVRGQIQYAGRGFKGHSEDMSFVETFDPVNPEDLEDEEVHYLLSLCPPNTKARTGFIFED